MATEMATEIESVTAYCKVCKALTEHKVTEKKGTKPKRVQCSKCEDVHPYRASVPAPRKKAAAKTKPSPGDSYDSLIQGRDLSQSTKYAMSGQFEGDELIQHDVFGLGLVTRVLLDGKIEVLFPNGPKTLAHNR